ncbi:MAG: TraB/GumN family protein [Candidatus Woesearchaeota archaeon]
MDKQALLKNLVIVGTSHVARDSLTIVHDAFAKSNPDIVAVELDRNRLFALLHDAKPSSNPLAIFKIGFKGYFFALIGSYLQRKLGTITGVKPGSDMLLAVNLAKQHGKQVALIDQDIRITLKSFSKKTKARDKIRFIADIVFAPFRKKESLPFNIQEIPSEELVDSLLLKLKKRYPSFYRVLVTDRNRFMAKNISALLESNPEKKILCVIGAGHAKALAEDIEKL